MLGGLIKAEMLTVQAELSSLAVRKLELETITASRAAFKQGRLEAAEILRKALEQVREWTIEEKRELLELVVLRVEINRPDWRFSILSF